MPITNISAVAANLDAATKAIASITTLITKDTPTKGDVAKSQLLCIDATAALAKAQQNLENVKETL